MKPRWQRVVGTLWASRCGLIARRCLWYIAQVRGVEPSDGRSVDARAGAPAAGGTSCSHRNKQHQASDSGTPFLQPPL
jgi:hypothetical protein